MDGRISVFGLSALIAIRQNRLSTYHIMPYRYFTKIFVYHIILRFYKSFVNSNKYFPNSSTSRNISIAWLYSFSDAERAEYNFEMTPLLFLLKFIFRGGQKEKSRL